MYPAKARINSPTSHYISTSFITSTTHPFLPSFRGVARMPRAIVPGNQRRSHQQRPSSDSGTSNLHGSIRWLPLPSSDDTVLSLPRDCYDHPVVVLSNEVASDGMIELFLVIVTPSPSEMKLLNLIIHIQVTSFGGKALEEAHPQDTPIRHKYLPIKPCQKHPDHGLLLTLAGSCRNMDKLSYVNTGNRRRVPLSCLRDCNGKGPNYRLSELSYYEMIIHCDYVPTATTDWDLYFRRQEEGAVHEGYVTRSTQPVQVPTNVRRLPTTREEQISTLPPSRRVAPQTTRYVPGQSTYSTEHRPREASYTTRPAPPTQLSYGSVAPQSQVIPAARRWSDVHALRNTRRGEYRYPGDASASSGDDEWMLNLLGTVVFLFSLSCIFYGGYRGGVAVVGLAKSGWEWLHGIWDKIKIPTRIW